MLNMICNIILSYNILLYQKYIIIYIYTMYEKGPKTAWNRRGTSTEARFLGRFQAFRGRPLHEKPPRSSSSGAMSSATPVFAVVLCRSMMRS